MVCTSANGNHTVKGATGGRHYAAVRYAYAVSERVEVDRLYVQHNAMQRKTILM